MGVSFVTFLTFSVSVGRPIAATRKPDKMVIGSEQK